MSNLKLQDIKALREKTQAGVSDCRTALEESGGNFEKAVEWLKKKGIASAGKRADRVASRGLVETYIHGGGLVGSMVELNCETDFVARTEEFKKLAHEIAMQVAAMNPESVEALLEESYIRDEKLTIGDLVKEAIGKIGENIVVRRIVRFEVGQSQ